MEDHFPRNLSYALFILAIYISFLNLTFAYASKPLTLKMGYFRKLCLTNCDKILNFVTLEMGASCKYCGTLCQYF